MAKRIVWTEQAKADLRSIEQPMAVEVRCANREMKVEIDAIAYRPK